MAMGLAVLGIPAPAGAATVLGQVSPADPPNSGQCAGANFVQLGSGTLITTVPSPGVITMWSHRGNDGSAGSGRLQIWAPAGGAAYTLVGRSDVQAFTPGSVETYPTRVRVSAGDLLGLRTEDSAGCFYATGHPNDSIRTAPGSDPGPGDTVLLSSPGTMLLLNVSAVLEQDADQDGFGDETQDCDPADASKAQDCTGPQATITKGPKNKSKRKQATFEFASSEPGSSFECELDGGAFEPCNSPKIVKVSKGKHNFQVRTTDQAGNVGPPVSDAWKVKKKKKKKKRSGISGPVSAPAEP